LKGISTGDMSDALHEFLGDQARSLTPDLVSKLKKDWLDEYKIWDQRSFKDKRYVYIWADGIYSNVRIDNRLCLLVVLGVTVDGTKELISIHDGERESEQSWRELLIDLKHRGLEPPNLAVGDGAMGFWSAVTKIYPETRQQRCWFHKMGNVLNKIPKSMQPAVKSALQQIWMAKTKEDAYKAFDKFEKMYGSKYPKAVECLSKDKDELLTFYDFPALHWSHIRTTNPIESTFATIRLRTHRTKNCGSRDTTLMMVFKLAQAAEKRYHRLKGFCLLNDVAEGIQFKDGERVENAA
jgi:transposase-like protein